MKKEKQQKRPKRTKAQRVQALKTFAVDTVYDVVGSILFAIGVYTFAKSADFAPGGVSGLALICNYLWDLPIGTMTLIINIPIIIISYKVVGRKFLLKSFKTMVISTLFLDLVFPLTPLYTGNSFLAAIFSGVFMGAGLALIYMRGSSTGGTDFDAVLYGVISTYAASVIIDKIIYGAGSGKLAIIITTDGYATAKKIDEETGRGATLIKAIGTYSGIERHLILCACGKAEIFKVRNAAHAVDPNAFVMITEASEVFGEGFTPPELDQ